MAGGQVTGVVGDNATVQNSNAAAGVGALSGPALTANLNLGTVGPNAASIGPSQAAQSGSNSLDLSQSSTTETGDAVAGGQVNGIVGEGEHSVQGQNSCIILCVALSSPAASANLNLGLAGPRAVSLIFTAQTGQVGDNDAVISQSSSTKAGDAVAGGQVTGGVGGSATVMNSNTCLICISATSLGLIPTAALNVNAGFAGPLAAGLLNGQTSQTGNNSLDLAQDAITSTGDAVAGSQVTGWVGDANGFLTVMNQQASAVDFAISGPVAALNGNFAFGGPVSASLVNAQSSQNGDNSTVASQVTTTSTGDALAGAQVTGGVGGDITVSETNASIGTLAISGSVLVGINVSIAAGGPAALGLITSSASQMGDNSTSLEQSLTVETGDAVAGAQIVGAVAEGDVTVQTSNQGTLAFAFSGGVAPFILLPSLPVFNFGAAFGGPVAGPSLLNAQTQQAGDNNVAQNQEITVSSGDAVAGAQVLGAVADGDVIYSTQNAALLTGALSGSVLGFNLGGAFGSPVSLALLNANASQLGDNNLAISTTVTVESGDAVSGAQVLGAVSGGDVTIQNSNSGILVASATGIVVGFNFDVVRDGPVGFGLVSGSASHTGDISLAYSQDVTVSSGDAVAGSAVVGAVADGDITVSGSNSGIGVLTVSGPAIGFNIGFIGAGPLAAGFLNAQTQQFGDNSTAISQSLTVETGDAISGSQITGAVSTDGDITIAVQNSGIFVFSFTTPAIGVNIAPATVAGPLSIGFLNSSASQFGDNSTAVSQELALSTGDAVAGSQINGAVASGSDVTVMGSNSSIVAVSLSGAVIGTNVAASFAGPVAIGIISGSASQFGSNDMVLSQEVDVTSGDAVSGSQITGVVADDDGVVTISNMNSAIASFSLSGFAIAPNFALAVGGPAATGLLSAQAQQTGDNTLTYAQDLSVSSGDGVAGAQVTGVVGGRLVPVQLSNSDFLSLGLSGFTVGFNVAGGGLTPFALSAVSARVQQNGDSDLNGSQNLETASGDAVSGGQVSGRVGAGVSGLPGVGEIAELPGNGA